MWHRWKGMHIFLSEADIFLLQRSVSNSTVSSSVVMRPSVFNWSFCWVIKVTWELLKELEVHVSASVPCQQPCLKAEVQNCFYDSNLPASVCLSLQGACKKHANSFPFTGQWYSFLFLSAAIYVYCVFELLDLCYSASSPPSLPLPPPHKTPKPLTKPPQKQAGKKNLMKKCEEKSLV